MANRLLTAVLTALLVLAGNGAQAERLKDIAGIAGVRSNPLVGYGLVVGLDGTGEQTPYTAQAFKSMLSRFGIVLPEGQVPKVKNVAAVAIHAELPPYAKPGQAIDVTVSSLGEAKSLRGGALLMAPLRGVDGEIYAIAQGNLVVGGFGAQGNDGSKITVNVPTSGRIPNGATVERMAPNGFALGDSILLNLHAPDFTTAKRVAEQINKLLGPLVAQPLDAGTVEVGAPRDPARSPPPRWRWSRCAAEDLPQRATGHPPARPAGTRRT